MKKCIISAIIAALMIGLAGCGGKTSAFGKAEVPAQEIDPAEKERLQEEIDQSLEDYDEDIMREGYLEYSMKLFAGSVTESANKKSSRNL